MVFESDEEVLLKEVKQSANVRKEWCERKVNSLAEALAVRGFPILCVFLAMMLLDIMRQGRSQFAAEVAAAQWADDEGSAAYSSEAVAVVHYPCYIIFACRLVWIGWPSALLLSQGLSKGMVGLLAVSYLREGYHEQNEQGASDDPGWHAGRKRLEVVLRCVALRPRVAHIV
nr:hypothetical protein Iba_chr12fCG22050 [Ipomoea batatas]